MKSNFTIPALFKAFIALLLLLLPCCSYAQCSNWGVSAQVTAAANCAANGAFTASLTGPDAANLTNVQYGIPLAANGFSVPLNSSPNFAGTPPGTYQVSVVATCGGVTVGRNTTITVPGSYTAPILNAAASSIRASLSCLPTGQIYPSLTGGIAPYTFNITSHPSAYTGPTAITYNFAYATIDQLPPGTYTIQVVDGCQSGTVPVSFTVGSINPLNAPFATGAFNTFGCDTLSIRPPSLNTSGPWAYYAYDTGFKWSVHVSGGIAAPTPYIAIGITPLIIKLPAGKTIKDLYGDTIFYSIQPPCGPPLSLYTVIPMPVVSNSVMQHCNVDFDLTLGINPVCRPVTYTLHNNGTSANYGPYVSAANSLTIPGLPLGSFTISFTTADGFSGTRSFNVAPINARPYSVSVISGSLGLHNYAGGFSFFDSSAFPNTTKTVELFSGPAGYSFTGLWTGNLYTVLSNQSPTASTLKFPPGNYVWKITDNCGVYYLPVTVGAPDLYQFTVNPPVQTLTCQGLQVTLSGTATNNGSSRPIRFALLLNGQPYYSLTPTGALAWQLYTAGTPILLTSPGTYTILPTSGNSVTYLAGYYTTGGFRLAYPTIYTSTLNFTYTRQPLAVDVNQTQGFLCKGAQPGQGQIFAKGKDGSPFLAAPSPHYNYYLALAGNGATGPYLANNVTGVFTGFGGNANALYDIKVEDSCGAFAVYKVKILDLGTGRLISASQYVSCIASNVQLSAVFLPNATYAWTGPNGFTSTLRQPVISNASALNAGVYHVTITTSACNQAVSDSTVLVINPNPPKPLLSYVCLPRPVQLSVSNATAGLIYKWDVGSYNINTGNFFHSQQLQLSDTPWSKLVMSVGSYAAVAIDTTTGCTTKSDSVTLLMGPMDTLRASIYSPHLQLCVGDTTALVAKWRGTAYSPTIQWYRNGTAIAGANSVIYTTSQAGTYRVLIDAGLCNIDTSAPVTVTVVQPPVATTTASAHSICQGDTALLQASTGTGYTYNWYRNGTVIPAVFTSSYPATLPGIYQVVISNGGCIAAAQPDTITVVQRPVATISPAALQGICPGGTIRFSTVANAQYSYAWLRNGTVMPGAVSDTFTAGLPGFYMVVIGTAQCPNVPSAIVQVQSLPASVTLPQDTTVCDDAGFPITISVADSNSFTSIAWSTGATSPQTTAAASGIYWVNATNSCGMFSDTIRIYSKADYQPALPDDTLVCTAAGIARFAVPPALSNIQWSTGASAAAITIDSPGIYWVQALSPCGQVTDTVHVHFCAPAIQDVSLSADSLCEGDCLSVTANVSNYADKYQWLFEGGNPASSASSSPGTVCYAKAGIYTVMLIATNKGGADTALSTIVVSAKPVPRFKDTVMRIPYKSVVGLPACAPAQRADWYKGDSLVCASCPILTIEAKYYQSVYRCVVRNGDCPDSCSYALQVIDIPHELWLPDAFTPNGDSRNDLFHVITDNPNIQVVNLDVYNRWGQRVFVSNLNNNGWDGSFRGQPAAAGTYFWQLRYRVRGSEDVVYSRKGDVLLVR